MIPETNMHERSERRLSSSGIGPRPCEGCNGPIPKRKEGGRPRKWCSDECRSQAHARPSKVPCRGCGVLVDQPPRSRTVMWCSNSCRKKACYAGTCEECGGPTDGSNGPDKASKRCVHCIVWTRGAVIAALNAWADSNGGIPPTCTDQREAPTGVIPSPIAVKRLFGSWNEGLLAAGFELKTDRRPETAAAILRAVREGEHTRHIAQRLGCTTANIHQRLKHLGTSVSAERPDWYVPPSSKWDYIDRD